jgi:hypothetical protein
MLLYQHVEAELRRLNAKSVTLSVLRYQYVET